MKTSVILFCVVTSLFLFSSGFASASSRFDAVVYGETTQVVHQCGVNDSYGSCCNLCICTRSIPPQCRCTDIKHTCNGCSACVCTRSIPPQCQCRDIKPYCAPSGLEMGSKSLDQ